MTRLASEPSALAGIRMAHLATFRLRPIRDLVPIGRLVGGHSLALPPDDADLLKRDRVACRERLL